MLVPFNTPRMERTSSPARDSRSARTTGTPAATAPSHHSRWSRLTSRSSKAGVRATACLLAVTTVAPRPSADRSHSDACAAPLASMTTSMSGSPAMSAPGQDGFAREQLLGERRADRATADEAEADDRWSHALLPHTSVGLSHPRTQKIPDGEKPRDTWLFSVCLAWPQYAANDHENQL